MKNITFIYLLLLMISCKTDTAEKSIAPQPVKNIEIEEQVEAEQSELFVTNEQFKMSDMKIDSAETRLFNTKVQATGLVEIPQTNSASVSSLMGGKINGLHLIPGQYVKKGQQLFRIQNIDLIDIQQDYLEVSQSIHYLREEYNRNKILVDEKISAEKNKLKAESEYLQAMARKKGMEERLKLLGVSPDRVLAQEFQSSFAVFAPISGYVKEIYFNDGATVVPTDIVIDMYNMNKLHIDLQVFEKDIQYLKRGMAIQYTIPEFSTEKYKAKIHFLGNMIDDDARTLSVHADIITKPKKLVAGTYVNAEVAVDSQPHLSLPESAVVESEGKYYVFALTEKTNSGYDFEQILLSSVGEASDGYIPVDFLTTDAAEQRAYLTNGAYFLLAEE